MNEKLVLSKITKQTSGNRIDNEIASPIDKLIEWLEGKGINIEPNEDETKVILENDAKYILDRIIDGTNIEIDRSVAGQITINSITLTLQDIYNFANQILRAGTGIQITQNAANNTLTIACTVTNTDTATAISSNSLSVGGSGFSRTIELNKAGVYAQNKTILKAGTNISLSNNDTNSETTINSTVSNTDTATNITSPNSSVTVGGSGFNRTVDLNKKGVYDQNKTILKAGTGISLSNNDTNNETTINSTVTNTDTATNITSNSGTILVTGSGFNRNIETDNTKINALIDSKVNAIPPNTDTATNITSPENTIEVGFGDNDFDRTVDINHLQLAQLIENSHPFDFNDKPYYYAIWQTLARILVSWNGLSISYEYPNIYIWANSGGGGSAESDSTTLYVVDYWDIFNCPIGRRRKIKKLVFTEDCDAQSLAQLKNLRTNEYDGSNTLPRLEEIELSKQTTELIPDLFAVYIPQIHENNWLKKFTLNHINYNPIIRSRSFCNCVSLTEVNVFPCDAQVREIEPYAFAFCRNLKIVNLRAAIIGEYAFMKSGITDIDFVDMSNVNPLRDGCFALCVNLTDVNLVDTYGVAINRMPKDLFFGCRNLHSINAIGVSSLSDYCMGGCDSLRHLTLPIEVQIDMHPNYRPHRPFDRNSDTTIPFAVDGPHASACWGWSNYLSSYIHSNIGEINKLIHLYCDSPSMDTTTKIWQYSQYGYGFSYKFEDITRINL